MRECQRNYAHGPMRLKNETVEVAHRNTIVQYEKTVYFCSTCGFELEQQWMKDKAKAALESAGQKEGQPL